MTPERLREWRGVKPVAGPCGVAISTRLPTTGDDERVLELVAEHLGRLRRADLATVARPEPLAPGLDGAARRHRLNTRKAALTAQSSARSSPPTTSSTGSPATPSAATSSVCGRRSPRSRNAWPPRPVTP
jgi:hypothetical protein